MPTTHLFAVPIFKSHRPDVLDLVMTKFETCTAFRRDRNGLFTTLRGTDYCPGRTPVFYDPLVDADITAFTDMVSAEVDNFLLENNYREYHTTVVNMWMVAQGSGVAHPPHNHYGHSLSGVYYVHCPAGSHGLMLHSDDELGRGHVLKVRDNQYTPTNSLVWNMPVAAGDLLLFPSWLRHSVPAGNYHGQRISVAFDIDLKPKDLTHYEG
jgi:uncharacterized protein (TIGR02466 family)